MRNGSQDVRHARVEVPARHITPSVKREAHEASGSRCSARSMITTGKPRLTRMVCSTIRHRRACAQRHECRFFVAERRWAARGVRNCSVNLVGCQCSCRPAVLCGDRIGGICACKRRHLIHHCLGKGERNRGRDPAAIPQQRKKTDALARGREWQRERRIRIY